MIKEFHENPLNYIKLFEEYKKRELDGKKILIVSDGLYNVDVIERTLVNGHAEVHVLNYLCKKNMGSDESKSIPAIEDQLEAKLSRMQRVDVLVTNLFAKQENISESYNLKYIQHDLPLSLCNLYKVTTRVASQMKKNGTGKIINLVPFSGKRLYLDSTIPESALSSAMIGMCRSMAETYAPSQITVNTIVIGLIETIDNVMKLPLEDIEKKLPFQWLPLKKFGTGEDVANAVAFLSSDFSSYITGYSMDINGGFVMD